MSQQVKIEDAIIFQGAANKRANVSGNFMLEKVIFHDHFIVAVDESDWVEEETNGGTIAQAAANGGTETLTTGGVDDDVAEFSHAAQWSGSKNCVMEARLKLTSIENVGVNVGWIDADMSADNKICFELTAGAATLVDARGADGACFVYDTDGAPDYWYMAAVKAATEGTPVSLAIAPTAATYANFRVALNTSGDATFYYNGKMVGHQAAAVTAATLMCPYVSVIARTGAAKVVTVDRITCWQDE